MSIQHIIVYIILALAAAYIIRKAVKHFCRKTGDSQCSGCPLADGCGKKCCGCDSRCVSSKTELQ